MKSIRDSDSVPQALRSILESRSTGRPLSIRELSKRLGYNSDRTVGMVAKNERAMGTDMIRRLSEFAKLSRKDKDYLALLAEKQRNELKGRTIEAINKRIAESKVKPSVSKVVEVQRLESLTPWFTFSIIEILRLIPNPATQEEIHRELRGAVQVFELEQTLLALSDFKYIIRIEDGRYRMPNADEYLTTSEDLPSMTIRKMHRRQLERAVDTLNEQGVHEREMIGKTFTVSARRIGEFKERVREVMEELAEEFVAPTVEDAVVVQLNQQLYQQSKPRTKPRDPEHS